MWKNSSRVFLTLARRNANNNFKAFTLPALSLFNHNVPVYHFAKQGVKKQERVAQKQEKKEATVSKEIDLKAIETKMTSVIETFKADIAKIKPGRLTQQNFETTKIVAYGEKRPLAELVQFIPKTANTVAMNVFDEGMVTDIIKTLEASKDSLTIKRDGKTITCTLVGGNTKEMKEGLVKQVKAEYEKVKDKIRDVRSEAVENVKKMEKFLLKDALVTANKEIQNMNDKAVADLDKVFKAKEKELLSA